MDKYNEGIMNTCDSCFYPDSPIPVVVERIMRHYRNPDGSCSNRMYYQYPVTCFSAVHKDENIHSPTLTDVLYSMNQELNNKQKSLMSGDMNTILTRGRLDGEVGELTKTDYLDDTRRSKTHVPSEHALFKLSDRIDEKVHTEVQKETIRALDAEESIRTMIVDETNRATDAENKLQDSITDIKNDALFKNDFCGNKLVTNIIINPADLQNILWQLNKIDPVTMESSQTNGSWDLKTPIEQIVTNKFDQMDSSDPSVKISTFDDVDRNVLVSKYIQSGEGSMIAKHISVYKNVETGMSQNKTTNIYSDTMNMSVSQISDNSVEIHLNTNFNDDADVIAAFEQMYA